MKINRLAATTVFRLAVTYSALLGALTIAIFGLVYWSNASLIHSQTKARLQGQVEKLLSYDDLTDPDQLATAVAGRSQNAGFVGYFYLLVNEDGERIAGNLQSWPGDEDDPDGWITFHHRPVFSGTDSIDWKGNEEFKVVARVATLPNDRRLLVGRGLYEVTELSEQSLGGLFVASTTTVVLSLIVGTIFARRVLARVERINATLGDIVAGRLSRRLDVGTRQDELSRLSLKINKMLDRIEQLVTGLRDVTSNVSHDLRSPLQRLRNRLELLLVRGVSDDEQQAHISAALNDIDDILNMFDVLLSIAQAEAKVLPAQWQVFDMATVTRDIADLYSATAEDQGLTLECRAVADQHVLGNGLLVGQALANLLENAIKYTPNGGRIRVHLTTTEHGIDLHVSDTGPGIDPGDRERVLKRFQRLDCARSSPGSGLGLSLVQAVVHLHQGTLTLEDNEPGLRVVIRFPRPETDTAGCCPQSAPMAAE